MREPVKGKTVAGRRREKRAWRTRRRIARAAIRLFLERSYAATTVEAVAHAAGVSPATVYQAFGNKQSILAAALDATIAGDGEDRPVLDREWVQRARAEPDAEERLQLIVRHTSEIAARTAASKEVIRDAAAVEPSMRALIDEDHSSRRRTQEALVRIILGAADGSEASVRAAADTYYALVNSDTYRLLVMNLGWSYGRWAEWLVQQLRPQLVRHNA